MAVEPAAGAVVLYCSRVAGRAASFTYRSPIAMVLPLVLATEPTKA